MEWPKYRISGGPHGKNTRVEKDGKVIHGLTGVGIRFDVDDVVRLTLQSMVEAQEVEVEGVAVHRVTLVGSTKAEDGGWAREAVAVATGDDLVLALRALADSIEGA